MTEANLYEQLAQYLSYQHPKLRGLWHFDLAGVNNPSHKTRNLYGRLNQRAYPDFFLAKPVFQAGTINVHNGLFLELKREGTRLRKRDGQWASEHIAEQAETFERLRDEGYIANFAVGFDECKSAIDNYLGGQPEADDEF